MNNFLSKFINSKLLLLFLVFASVQTNKGTNNEEIRKESGGASFYAKKFHGRKTASGERFDNQDFTCAHKYLPFGTKLKITNPDNQKSVIVRVNDRGPYVKGRIVDLSHSAAKVIGLVEKGIGKVMVEKIDQAFSDVGSTEEMEEILLNSNYTYINKKNKELILKIKNFIEQADCESVLLLE
jgi:rare lipoprotein A